jgi:hypothetical protein
VKKYVPRVVFLKKERNRPADTHFWTGKSVSRDDCERARSRERKRREKGGKKGEEIGRGNRKEEGGKEKVYKTDRCTKIQPKLGTSVCFYVHFARFPGVMYHESVISWYIGPDEWCIGLERGISCQERLISRW